MQPSQRLRRQSQPFEPSHLDGSMRCAMTPGFAGAGRSGKRSSTIDVNHDVLEEVVCEVVEEREWRLHPCALAGLCWAAGAASIVIDTCLSRGRIARFILLAGVLPRHGRQRHSRELTATGGRKTNGVNVQV